MMAVGQATAVGGPDRLSFPPYVTVVAVIGNAFGSLLGGSMMAADEHTASRFEAYVAAHYFHISRCPSSILSLW